MQEKDNFLGIFYRNLGKKGVRKEYMQKFIHIV